MAGPKSELSQVEQGVIEARQAVLSTMEGIHGALLQFLSSFKGKNQHDVVIQMQQVAEELDHAIQNQYNLNQNLVNLDREVQKLPMLTAQVPNSTGPDLQKQVKVLNDEVGKYIQASNELKAALKAGQSPTPPQPESPRSNGPKQ